MINLSNKKNEKIKLKDVSNNLRKALKLVPNVPYELLDFVDYLASVAGNHETEPIGMIILLKHGLDDLEKNCCGFANKVPFPEKIKNKKKQILIYLSYFPLIIDEIASNEFAEEFRKLFTEIFCEAQPPIKKQFKINNFGVTIVKKGVVDISKKDAAEVLAALYNNSKPRGMGILQYNPEPMTTKQAREILNETTCFDYLNGRPMKVKVSLESDTVDTSYYNEYNGYGSAEYAISQCRNIK